MVNHKTQLNMIIGYPLEHTQSPLLHNTLYDLLPCNAVMLAHSSQDLASTMQALKTLSVSLIAVTMPFKQNILRYIDHLSVEVEALKAANTIICRQGKLFGYNTDIDGIAYAFRKVDLCNKNILMVGAGGASHAAAYYFTKNNAHLFWLNRTEKTARCLMEHYGGNLVDANHLEDLSLDIIVNATPLGMFPHQHRSILEHYHFRSHQIVFDMVYNPIDTVLLKRAKTQGAFCISGIDMFIGQGLKQIELWLNESLNTSTLIDFIKPILEASQEKLEATT